MDETSELVYHYCSFDTFIKIIEEKKLRFSDIYKSNDYLELDFLWKAIFEKWKTIDNQFNNSLHYFKNEQDEYMDCLVCCFSKKSDDLHMWSTYASNGGVAIGFDMKLLQNWGTKINLLNNAFVYNENSEPKENENKIARCGDVVYLNDEKLKETVDKESKNWKLITDALNYAFDKAPFLKSEFWSIENEWRIVLKLFIENELNDIENYKKNIDGEICKIKANSNPSFSYKFYCEIPFNSDLIKKITLSPNCKSGENGVKKLLLVNGLKEVEISKSIGSLR